MFISWFWFGLLWIGMCKAAPHLPITPLTHAHHTHTHTQTPQPLACLNSVTAVLLGLGLLLNQYAAPACDTSLGEHKGHPINRDVPDASIETDAPNREPLLRLREAPVMDC